jgi:hypothetical protein
MGQERRTKTKLGRVNWTDKGTEVANFCPSKACAAAALAAKFARADQPETSDKAEKGAVDSCVALPHQLEPLVEQHVNPTRQFGGFLHRRALLHEAKPIELDVKTTDRLDGCFTRGVLSRNTHEMFSVERWRVVGSHLCNRRGY